MRREGNGGRVGVGRGVQGSGVAGGFEGAAGRFFGAEATAWERGGVRSFEAVGGFAEGGVAGSELSGEAGLVGARLGNGVKKITGGREW